MAKINPQTILPKYVGSIGPPLSEVKIAALQSRNVATELESKLNRK